MKLLYRGLHHPHYLPTLEVTDAEIAARYRGVTYHSPVLRVPLQLQPRNELVYRGVPYTTGEHAGQVSRGQSAIASHSQPKNSQPKNSQPKNSQPKTERTIGVPSVRSPRIAEVHGAYLRQNLERRLQSAQDRGDHHLVYLLEAERRQLA
jgi:Domain of unknown function (DUF4278)